MGSVTLAPALDAALRYASRGWAVFPVHTMRGDRCSCGHWKACDSPGKHPRTPNGLKDASTAENVLRSWWKQWPDANVAIVTGAVSGLVVIDIDGDVGRLSLDELVATRGPLPVTLEAQTGGHGRHLLFVHPGEEIRNSAGSKLGPCLDVRGDGGYIVAAPSLHKSGRLYEWVDFSADLAEMPAWLVERLRKPVPSPAPMAAAVLRPDAPGTAYVLEAVAREVAALRSTGQGGRNDQLNRSAFNLGQLVAGGELDEGLARAELEAAALSVGLGEHEIEVTMASGLASGKLQPRRVPERPQASHPSWVRDPDDPAATEPPVRHLALVAGGEGDPPAPLPGEPSEGRPIERLTDLGNARRLVRLHLHELRYVPQWRTWLAWDGRRWRRDATGEVQRRAKEVVGQLHREAWAAGGGRGEEISKWAQKSEAEVRLRAMVEVATTEPLIPVEPNQLDADPWLLNVLNGTIDLRTGILREHRPGDLMTKMAPVAYDPAATYDRWDAFLDQVTDGDESMVTFLRRAAGYTLTGLTTEEKLFFCYGPTASGKSTFLDALGACLGDYSMTADFETFVAKEHSGGAKSDVARLAGSRYVRSVEVDEGKRLAEGLVKGLTGGDLITARFLYGNEFEFLPAFKLWLAANDAPRVRHSDEALWRRILRVPFDHSVPEGKRDPTLKRDLRSTTVGGPAVLAWAVRGCLEWQQEKLGVPARVVEETAAYRDEQDPLKEFLEDRCIERDGVWCTKDLLYSAYEQWAGKRPMSRRKLAELLTHRGFQEDRKRVGGEVKRLWIGLGVAEHGDTASQEEVGDDERHSVTASQRHSVASQQIMPLSSALGVHQPGCDAVTEDPETCPTCARVTRARMEEFPETASTASQRHAPVPRRCFGCGSTEVAVIIELDHSAWCRPCYDAGAAAIPPGSADA